MRPVRHLGWSAAALAVAAGGLAARVQLRGIPRYPAFTKNPAGRVPGIRMPAWEGVIRDDERSLQLPEETR